MSATQARPRAAVQVGTAGEDRVIERVEPEVILDLTTQRTRSDDRATRTIPIVSGVGSGSTELAAFDHALRLTGIANYNLVRLSSVIPPATTIVPTEGAVRPGGTWGDRLYVVYASWTASQPGDGAWAGVAWVQDLTADGRGLFVEHEGATEEDVRNDLVSTLSDMTAGRSGNWTEPRLAVTGGVVEDRPICALVAAAYETAAWDPDRALAG